MAPPMQPPAPTQPPRYTSGQSSLSQLFEGLKSLGEINLKTKIRVVYPKDIAMKHLKTECTQWICQIMAVDAYGPDGDRIEVGGTQTPYFLLTNLVVRADPWI